MNYRDNNLRPPAEILPVTGCALLLGGLAAGWPADVLQPGLAKPVLNKGQSL